jgi:hypothetical protein
MMKMALCHLFYFIGDTMKDIIETACETLKVGISKFHSRKFLGWIVASVALFTHYITNEQWMMVTMAWYGIQGAIDYKSTTNTPSQ